MFAYMGFSACNLMIHHEKNSPHSYCNFSWGSEPTPGSRHELKQQPKAEASLAQLNFSPFTVP